MGAAWPKGIAFLGFGADGRERFRKTKSREVSTLLRLWGIVAEKDRPRDGFRTWANCKGFIINSLAMVWVQTWSLSWDSNRSCWLAPRFAETTWKTRHGDGTILSTGKRKAR
ncbi:hypothetical protein BJ508DRAFT_174691 [Ascobolus immersus RN42]|uniref:Uncharacterized protein n=1 Tax=Ascobolus immersus RN42 TaxID=1160509 RepID=A0A3N4HYM7_ASCIM|nr:hypothetical protein BJ508DRAFT_174691 [Ascobolus immersus RN42]